MAVHGLNGDALRTWTSDKGKICWLDHPEFLPKHLPRSRILTWGYNANWISSKGRTTCSNQILHHAYTLIAQLDADRYVGVFPLETYHLVCIESLLIWSS